MRRQARSLYAVLDTNIFVSGSITPRGASFQLLEAWRMRRFRVVTSEIQIQEVDRVLNRPKFTALLVAEPYLAAAVTNRMRKRAEVISELLPSPIPLRDPDDEIILSIAHTAKADYLVTGDKDLLSVAEDIQIRPVRIVRLRTFLELLSK